MPTLNEIDNPCASRDALQLVSDKWSNQIVIALAAGPRRTGELQRDLGNVSQKVLTASLRSLERDGLVKRAAYPVVPPRVDYQLTELGQSLHIALGSVCQWGNAHMAQVNAAREEWERVRG